MPTVISITDNTVEINGNTFTTKKDMKEDDFVKILETIGFKSNLIKYSFDRGLIWNHKVIDYIYNVLNEYRNSAYYSKDAVHLRDSSAHQFSISVLKTIAHDHIIIKPIK